MRILISNPDTIGDVVLRQPMFGALTVAGHELMLVVRPMLAPIMGLLAPGARVEVCDLPVYDPRLGVGAPELDAISAAAAAFDPDIFVVAPYQWTVLEERLAFDLLRARCIAMSGLRYGDVNFGPAPRSRIEPQVLVEVARDLHELRKNERVASAVLGKAVSLPDPVVIPDDRLRSLAESVLARAGLSAGGYWVACVGDSASTALRNWSPEHWGELLGRWSREHGEKFLFVGLRSEAATVARVRGSMGEAAASTAEWSGDGGGDLETLVGLLSHSKGYVGRDTGPMHLSAALGKPVAAVFGGGTWPRFVPAGKRSIAVTVGVPCAGCEWHCHLSESYCIKRVPVDQVWRAVEEVRSGKVKEPGARILAPEAELLVTIGREGAESARRRLVQASVARRELVEERKSMSQNGAPAEGAIETLYGPEPKPGAFRESKREESAAQVARFESRLAEAARQRGEQQGLIESLREQLGESRARARDLETRLERRTGELLTATAETAAFKERMSQMERTLATTKRESDQARQQADTLADTVKRAQAETAGARTELQQARAELQQSRTELQQARNEAKHAAEVRAQVAALQAQIVEVKGSAESLTAERNRLTAELASTRDARDVAVRKLNEGGGPTGQLAQTQRDLGQAKADLHDLRIRAQKLDADRTAMAKLTRQHEETIATLQTRLNELLASRWRRYGQKAGIVMTLPWERELPNGTA